MACRTLSTVPTNLERVFSSTLSSLSCLRTLSVGNAFTWGGVLSVVAARLPSLQSLEALHVSDASLNDTTSQELAQGIGHCIGLKTVFLDIMAGYNRSRPPVAVETSHLAACLQMVHHIYPSPSCQACSR